MLINCNDEKYIPKNPYIEQSQMARNIFGDLGVTDEAILIPSEYYHLTNIILELFDTIKFLLATNEFIKGNKELVSVVPCAQYFRQWDFHAITIRHFTGD